MKLAIVISLFVFSALFSDPPGAGPPLRTADNQISRRWDDMSQRQRQQALDATFNQNDPMMWASLSESQKRQRMEDYNAILSNMDAQQRQQFLQLSPLDQQAVLYEFYTNSSKAPDALETIVQQSQAKTYQFKRD